MYRTRAINLLLHHRCFGIDVTVNQNQLPYTIDQAFMRERAALGCGEPEAG
jgi:hypothetical protein